MECLSRRSTEPARPARFIAFHRRQAEALPDERDYRQRHEAEKGAAPADGGSQIAAKRRGHDGRQRIATVENRQRAGNLVRGYQPDGGGRRHRPESPDNDANQGSSRHIGSIAVGQRDNHSRDRHQNRQPQQKVFTIQTSGKVRDSQAGQHRQGAGNGNALACQPLGDV